MKRVTKRLLGKARSGLAVLMGLALLVALAGTAAQGAPNTVTKIAIVRGAIGDTGSTGTKNTFDASLDLLSTLLTNVYPGQTIQYAVGTVTGGVVDYSSAYTLPGKFASPGAGLNATQKQILNNVDLIVVCPGLNAADYSAYSLAGGYDAPSDWNALQVPIMMFNPYLPTPFFSNNPAPPTLPIRKASGGWNWTFANNVPADTTLDTTHGSTTAGNGYISGLVSPYVTPTDPLFTATTPFWPKAPGPTTVTSNWVNIFKSAYVIATQGTYASTTVGFGYGYQLAGNNAVLSAGNNGNPGRRAPISARFETNDWLGDPNGAAAPPAVPIYQPYYAANPALFGVTNAGYRRFVFPVSSLTDYQGFPKFFDASLGATDDCKLLLNRALIFLYNPQNGRRPAPNPGPAVSVGSNPYTIPGSGPNAASCKDVDGGALNIGTDVTLTWSIAGPAGSTPTVSAGQGTLTPTFTMTLVGTYTVTLKAQRGTGQTPSFLVQGPVLASKTITLSSSLPQPIPNPGPNELIVGAAGATSADFSIPAAPSTHAAGVTETGTGAALATPADVTVTWTITGPAGSSTAGGSITSGASNSYVPSFHLAQLGIYTVTLQAQRGVQAPVSASKTIEFGIPSVPYIVSVSPGDNRLINALNAAAGVAPNNPVTIQFDHPIALTGPGTLPLTVTLGANAPVTVNCVNPTGDGKTWVLDGAALNPTLQTMPTFTKVSFSLDSANVADKYSPAVYAGPRYSTWSNVFAPATGATPMPKQGVLVVSNFAAADQAAYLAYLQDLYGIDTPITFWDNTNFATNGAQASALVIVFGSYGAVTTPSAWSTLTKPLLMSSSPWLWRSATLYGNTAAVVPNNPFVSDPFLGAGSSSVVATNYTSNPFFDGVQVNSDGTVPWWVSNQYTEGSNYNATDTVAGKTLLIASKTTPNQKFGNYFPANTVFYQPVAGGNTATAAGRIMLWPAGISYDLDRVLNNTFYPGLLRMTDNAKKMSANVHKYFAQPNGAPGVVWKNPTGSVATPLSKVTIRFDRPISGSPGMLSVKLQDGTTVTTCTATATDLESNMQFDYAIPTAQVYHAAGATTLTLSVDMTASGIGHETETGYSIPYIGPSTLVWTVPLNPVQGSVPVVLPSLCSPTQDARTGAFPATVVVHFSKAVTGVQASDLSLNPSATGYPTWLATQVTPFSGSAPDQDWIFTGPWSDTAHAAPAGNPPGYVPLETLINLRIGGSNPLTFSHIYDPVTSLGVSPATWTYLYTWTPQPAAVDDKLWTLYE